MERSFVDDTTTKKRIERDKRAMIEALKQVSIATVAAKRAGIGTTTYYNWLHADLKFRDEAIQAQEVGRQRLNDVAESQIIKKMTEGYIPACIYWLNHNSQRYSNKSMLTPTQVSEVIETRDYLSKVLDGSLPVRIGRFVMSYFRWQRNIKRSEIMSRSMERG